MTRFQPAILARPFWNGAASANGSAGSCDAHSTLIDARPDCIRGTAPSGREMQRDGGLIFEQRRRTGNVKRPWGMTPREARSTMEGRLLDSPETREDLAKQAVKARRSRPHSARGQSTALERIPQTPEQLSAACRTCAPMSLRQTARWTLAACSSRPSLRRGSRDRRTGAHALRTSESPLSSGGASGPCPRSPRRAARACSPCRREARDGDPSRRVVRFDPVQPVHRRSNSSA